MENSQIADKFIQTMSSLIDLMKHEIEVVKNRQFKDLKKLQDKKTELSRTYENLQFEIQRNPKILGEMPEQEKSSFNDLYKLFRETLSANMLAIRSTHDAAEKVIEKIVGYVKKERGDLAQPTMRRKTGYGVYSASGVAAISCNRNV